jgi:hypothetical protein
MRKRHTAEFKAQMVQELLKEQKTVSQLTAEYGVRQSCAADAAAGILRPHRSVQRAGPYRCSLRRAERIRGRVHPTYSASARAEEIGRCKNCAGKIICQERRSKAASSE